MSVVKPAASTISKPTVAPADTVSGRYKGLSEDTKARLAFMRFGLGPKPGGRARMGVGPDAAFRACLVELNNPSSAIIDDSDVVVSSSNGNVFPATLENCGRVAANAVPNPKQADLSLEVMNAESQARYVHYLKAEVGFLERLVLFWNNHFSVFNRKARATVGHMERHAIRKNVLGKFSTMLEAVVTHPAMITFLDNDTSFGPTSKNGRQRKLSYNENLAREILELHTLGVVDASGQDTYSQQDVTELAKILTGWHVGSSQSSAPGQFQYVSDSHEGGSFTVLGKNYAQTSGPEQGKAVLRDLAAHPNTARHIATKLIRHFISDTPTTADVNSLTNTFITSGGNLLEVSRALLGLQTAWTQAFTRIKQPYLWQVSITRGLGLTAAQVSQNTWTYDWFGVFLGQRLWWRITPDGWPDDNYFWSTPDAISLRSDFAYMMVKQSYNMTKWPGARPIDLAKDLLSGTLRDAFANEIAAMKDDRYALSLLFSTPQYLRR